MPAPTVGVLALPGDVREHLAALARLDVPHLAVRRPEELEACDGLVIPGGESTTLAKLARTFEVFEPLRKRIASGLPVLGTCAGMILLADRVLDGAPGQETFGGLDVTVRRNAFGTQLDSFETDLDVMLFGGAPVHAAFIRAPVVEAVGERAEAVATLEDGRVVAVRQGALLGTSFHPEITGETRFHRWFLDRL